MEKNDLSYKKELRLITQFFCLFYFSDLVNSDISSDSELA